MQKLDLKVANVKCGGCASTIQEGLVTMPGIESVDVDIASGTVSINGTEIDTAAIQRKLGELGYPVQA